MPAIGTKTIGVTHTADKITWKFPPTGGGVAPGFFDSGQEFFKAGIVTHLVREVIQNSLDAHDTRYPDKPVIVRMKKINLTPDMVGAKTLGPHIKESQKRMEGSEPQGEKFCKYALKILSKKTIPTLMITDENTTGLTKEKWEALVYREGTPSKEGQKAAGGSFGIGKSAPYTASKLRLICYATRYLNRNRVEKFIARCRLVAHLNPSNHDQELQHIGFGNSGRLKDSRFPPIMGNGIHKTFRLQQKGSGIFIAGFEESNWIDIAKTSVARNFFAAIHEKKLQVEIDGYMITHETLNDIEFDDDAYENYYGIIKSGETDRIDDEFGSFELGMTTVKDEMKNTNTIAYINRKGMMITDEKQTKKNPFHPRINSDMGRFFAVLRAADDKTDALIRRMEPPTHEAIEYERISDDGITKAALANIRKSIDSYIRKRLGAASTEQKTVLNELSDILPFVMETGGGASTMYAALAAPKI